MSTLRLSSVAFIAVAWAAGSQWAYAQTAADPAEHAAHHPVVAASAAQLVTPKASTSRPATMAQMDAHMKAMQEMHQKLVQAKTPQERQKMMAQHMRLMQEGMAMMGGMPDAKDVHPGMGSGSPDPQMMEKRMDMMQSMMQMMMDRMQTLAPSGH